MTNKEKYQFDYFTLKNYQRLVALAIDRGFYFISYTDDFLEERKDVLWRHDVEFEPDIALKMAEIEYSLGAKATYFFQMHSPYYNLFDPHYTKVFNKIKSLGHNVGLHFDSHYYGIDNENQLNEYIELDKIYFETVLNVKIDVYSFHNTTSFTQRCLARTYGGLINVYSSFLESILIIVGIALAIGGLMYWEKCWRIQMYGIYKCSPTMLIGVKKFYLHENV